MANARKRKARRRAVDRGDRVKATPETLAKLKPHPIELLLAKGRDAGAIDPDQWQSADEISEAFGAITRQLGVTARFLDSIIGHARVGELSPHHEKLTVIWFAWSPELVRRLMIRPHVVVEWIANERLIEPHLFGRALDLWAKVRQDISQSKRPVWSMRRSNDLDRAGVTALTSSGS
jgi:hypothetical protein